VIELDAAELERREHNARHIGHILYGSLVATALLVASDDGLDGLEMVEAILATGLVLWIAHAFGNAVGRSLVHKRHVTLHEMRECLGDEAGLLVGFLLSIPAVLLGVLDVFPDARADDIAIGVLLGFLLVVGTLLGRSVEMSWPRAVMVGLVYPLLGALVILLELAVQH